MRIIVEPFGDGWGLRADHVANIQAFRSGAAAERAAWSLAGRLVTTGTQVAAEVVLRTGERIALSPFIGRPAPSIFPALAASITSTAANGAY